MRTVSKLYLLLVGAAAPFIALAQGGVLGTGQPTKICEIVKNLFSLVGVFGTIVMILAFAFLLYSAFVFITSAGNEEKIKTARQLIIYSLVGLAVAFLAVFADDIVVQLLPGGSFINQCAAAVFQ